MRIFCHTVRQNILNQVISGAQIRAARSLLHIKASELAEQAGISLRTLQRFEASEGIPDAQARLLNRVKAVLEAEGIEFFGDPATKPGVQLDRSTRSGRPK
jgi:DNA-binding transcriptional regulator YiaG